MFQIADVGVVMKTMSARDAKNSFGLLLDTARAEPVTIEKHGRPVVVVLAVEEYERLGARTMEIEAPIEITLTKSKKS
jgi:prevent-host-death family protein